MKRAVLLAAGLCVLGNHALADKVHLAGGNVVEGKATRKGDKVIVEIESGELTLPAESVERIESSQSDVQTFETRYEKLKPGDIKGLIELANFCRDHDMRGREQQLLQKVIEVLPDHKEARARLGYVQTERGWITRDEQMRAQGLVLHDGQWITREQLLAIERAQAEADTAARQREKAQLELESKRLELEKQRASKDAEATAQNAPQPPFAPSFGYGPYPTYAAYPTYAPYTTYTPYGTYPPSRTIIPPGCADPRCSHRAPTYGSPHRSFPIAGVRDPFDYFR
jgi:hypothetical protein